MRWAWWRGLSCGLLLPLSLAGASLPVVEVDDQRCLDAAGLEAAAGIALKTLPGRDEHVACGLERCAPVKPVILRDGRRFVPVSALAEALGLAVTFAADQRSVSLVATHRPESGATGFPGVGSLMPNLRFTKLDGAPVTLDELRGERVLINSWASW